MAANAAFANYLTGTLNFSPAQRDAVLTQGIEEFDDLKALSDTEISRMCTNIRRTPVQPEIPAVPAGRGGRGGRAGRPAVYPATIPITHERRLCNLAWYLRHLDRVQRDFDEDVADIPFLDNLSKEIAMEAEDRKRKMDFPAKMKSVAQIRATIDELDNYFENMLGANGAPLAYVTRKTVAPEDHVALFDFDEDEMIARAPHTPPYYPKDNAEVWLVIRHVMYDTEGWSWISQFERTRNGRAAYLAIKEHYLGTSNHSRIKMLAEKALENTYYEGDKKSFTFEKYCSIHKMAHKDLADYGEAVPEDKKVRKLLANIRTNHLQAACAAVVATEHLYSNFDLTVNYLTTFAASSQLLGQGPRNIAATGRGRGGDDRGGRGRGGRGGGRDGGRGGRGRGRSGGRGNRRGQDNHVPTAAEIANFVPHGDYIGYNLWKAITEDQRQAVRRLRETKNAGNKRTIDEVATENPAPAPTNSGDRMSQRQKK